MFRTEHDFTLPMGYLDADGTLHRHGVMRLATAADEILPLRDERVQRNPAYLTVILLSRVVTRLGEIDTVTPATIEGLFAADLGYLQELYNRINRLDGDGSSPPDDTEPANGVRGAERVGGSMATPSVN